MNFESAALATLQATSQCIMAKREGFGSAVRSLARAITTRNNLSEMTGFPVRLERYCAQFRAQAALGDRAPPAQWPRWGFGGGGKQCRGAEGDPDDKLQIEAPDQNLRQWPREGARHL